MYLRLTTLPETIKQFYREGYQNYLNFCNLN